MSLASFETGPIFWSYGKFGFRLVKGHKIYADLLDLWEDIGSFDMKCYLSWPVKILAHGI